MATISAATLAALLKVKIDAVDSQNGSIGNEEILLAISEVLVVAFQDNSLFIAPTNNGGVGTGTITSIGALPNLAWDAAPTGSYDALSTDTSAGTQFLVRINGTWNVSGFGDGSIPSDGGSWRPTNDINPISYEIRYTTSGDTATEIGGADLSGNWITLVNDMGLSLEDAAAGSKSTSVTVEVRETSDPLNTTTSASFTITADGVLFSPPV